MIYNSTVKTVEILLSNIKFHKEEYIDKNLEVPEKSNEQMKRDLRLVIRDLNY